MLGYNGFNSTSQNPFLRMRQRNILAPQPPETPHQRFVPPPPPPDEPDPRDDVGRYFDEMSRIQNSGIPALSAYKDALAHQPTQAEYAPGWKKRLLTALAGGAIAYGGGDGYGMAKDVQERPYHNAVDEYGRKIKGLGEAADIEQDAVDAKLKMLQNARAMGLKYDEFELKRREADSKMRNDTRTADAAVTRAEAYAKAQGKPRHQYRDQQDGSVLEINEDTGQQRVIPAKTVAAGTLKVAQRNAATNARNASTNVQRANTYASSVSEIERRDKEMERRPTAAQSRIPTPANQQEAEGMALDELMLDPDFKAYVKPGDSAQDYPQIQEDDGSEAYHIFIEALNAKTAEILSGKRKRSSRAGGR